MDPEDIRTATVVKLKKPHPCGGSQWEILRTGVEVKIRCTTCDRVVSLPRQKFVQRVQSVIEDENDAD